MDRQTASAKDMVMTLLRAGMLPDAHDIPVIETHIESAKRKVQLIAEQIIATGTADLDWKFTQFRLLQLAGFRADLDKVVAALQSVFSPVRRLPPEIIMEIFRVCADTHEAQETPGVPRSYCLKRNEHLKGVHYTLSHVCVHWRNVALSTPSLWSKLDISLYLRDASYCEEWDRAQEAMRVYLERSGNYPLTLNIEVPDRQIDMHPGMEVLVAHCHHWGNITLRITSGLYQTVLPQVRGNLPMLRSLIFAPSNPSDFSQVTMFDSAPLLREVDLSLPASMFSMPWEQLTNVTLRVRLTTLQELFRTSHALTSAVIHGTSTSRSSSQVPIHFPVLKELDIGDGFDILPLMTAPALESCTMMNMNLSYANTLLSFLKRSSVSLKRLSGWGMRMSVAGFLDVLNSLPDLEYLNVSNRDLFTDEFFQRLTYTNKDTQLLPRLKTIHIRDPGRLITPALLQFLESRSPQSKFVNPEHDALAAVHIEMSVQYEGGFIYNVKSVITTMRDQGVTISGRYTSYNTAI
ncbi:hypothetical protein HGRIS_012721 [Hohenbuehelia grisea]|uniref:F-box domain-containing protein n=1 Tax=Hohenbuehelia grisea TaxID=104357 RepID=A0ABR3IT46_9AGAR